MSTVFLTGGTGFVGSHTARRFLDEGWRVRALVRRPDRPGLLPEGVELCPGALLEPQRYREALQGCDVVVHIAGIVKARTLSDYRQVNVAGAGAIAAAAAEVCPEALFVHVSSQAAAGPARDGRPVTEADAPRPVSWYGQSKLEGERAVEKNFPGRWIIVRPSVVYGAGDNGLLEIFTIVSRGWAPVLAGGKRRVQLISGQDLARVLFLAANRPQLAGRRGFAAVETVTMGELSAHVAAMRCPPARRLPVPALAIRLAGVFESVREAISGASRPFNRDKAVEMLQPDWICDSAPFLRDVGFDDPTPWKRGLEETCRWYLKEGWLPHSSRMLSPAT